MTGGCVNDDLIKVVPLFRGFTEQEYALVLGGFVAGQCSANGALFKVGEQSDALYLLERGFVRLTTGSGQNLATLGQGSVLGEASLFQGAPYDISAIAASELEYWKLPDRKLREIVLQNPSIGLKLSQNFGNLVAQMEDYLVQRLSRTPELNNLPQHTLQAIAQHLETRAIRTNDVLFRIGEMPTGLYIVENGSFELRPETGSVEQDSQRVAAGGILGALSLLTNKPYVRTAVASEDSLLWALSAESFQAVNSRHPGLRRSLGRNVRARLGKADQAQAVQRLGQMPIFVDVPPLSMQAIAQRMVLQHVPAGERVYRVGESGDALYLIESGEIELTEENASGVVEEKARIGPGGYFGEMSLLTGLIRTEDATATRNTNLWLLSKAELDELTMHHPAIGKALSQGVAARLANDRSTSGGPAGNEDHFRKFPLLADLNATELQQVAEHLRPTRYRSGEQIYRVSSPAEMLFLLEKGYVRIQPLSGNSWTLGPGEAFGERALLSNQPHNTSVVAETDVDLWTLSKQDFEMLMNRYPSLAINMSRILSQRMMDPVTAEAAPLEAAVAPNAAARRRRSAAAATPELPARERVGFMQWFTNLSGWGKLRLALLILLLLWLILVAAPTALMALMRGTRAASGAFFSASSQALAAVSSLGSYEVAAADKQTAREVALVDSLAAPTPTYTPLPTSTPASAPTAIPAALNIAASNQSNEDNTPGVFVPAPADAQPVAVAANEAPTAAPAAVQAAAAPKAWDPRLDQLGITVDEAQVAPGQPYWRLIEGRWADEGESSGKHHIFVDVLDENGKRVVGQTVTVFWGDGNMSAGVEDKPAPEFGYNFQMYAAGYAYSTKVEGLPSDVVKGAGMGSIEARFKGIHTSYYFVFQRSTK
jgi:CRP-like cAMP-binding protein